MGRLLGQKTAFPKGLRGDETEAKNHSNKEIGEQGEKMNYVRTASIKVIPVATEVRIVSGTCISNVVDAADPVAPHENSFTVIPRETGQPLLPKSTGESYKAA